MNCTILLKYGEIALKGANMSYFENTLLRQIRWRLKKLGNFSVKKAQSTIYVRALDDNADFDGAYDICKRTFGIITLAKAYEVQKDMKVIEDACVQLAPELLGGHKTFKVEARRSDKFFPLKSPEICEAAGAAILQVTAADGVRVDVHNPQAVIRVEIRETAAYISGAPERASGGMPVGTNGKALLLLSGGIDSPVAGYMICKRGVKLEVMHFESFPYTSQRAKEKVVELARLLAVYNGEVVFHTVSVKEIQEELKKSCNDEYFTLLLRRFMMRISETIARENECKALVTGESVGQVASQTMDALCVTNSVVNMPVFRPCIGLDKEEIITYARRIGTFETSVLPYEDCCTVFTPDHPRTHPEESRVEAEESKIDVQGLLSRALAGQTVEYVTWGC